MERRQPYYKGGQGGQRQQYPQQQQQRYPPQSSVPQRPKKSYYSAPTKGPITVITNDFRIKSRGDQMIQTYSVDFLEGSGGSGSSGLAIGKEKMLESQESLSTTMSFSSTGQGKSGPETFQKFKIMNGEADRLKMIFQKHVFVGSNLFSTDEIEDDEVTLNTTKQYFGRTWTIIIRKVASFNLNTLNQSKMEDHPVALNFINSVIKSALRNSKLRQIGRSPLFFDPDQATNVMDVVETWPGFFTSTWIFQKGLYLIIDNVSKIISSQSCLGLLDELLYNKGEDAVHQEFIGSVVMTRYGQNRTYRVDAVRFDMSPQTYAFAQGEQGVQTNMVQYFKKQYNIARMNPKQPLLEIRQKRGTIYLPPELCTMVGIPTVIREDFRAMSQIKQSIFLNPTQKIEKITQVCQMIAHSSIAKDWDLQLNVEPDTIEAKILSRPSVINPYPESGGPVISLEENHKKTLGSLVHEPLHFQKWTVFCTEQDYESAKWLQDQMYSCSQQYQTGIKVEFAEFETIKGYPKAQDFARAIERYYQMKVLPDIEAQKKTKKAQHITQRDLYFFLIIIPAKVRKDDFYKEIKCKINENSPVITQFVQSKTLDRVYNKSEFTIIVNILRQINAKLGGDLWRMSFPAEISKKTMLVGIDVCHKGKQSFIGYVATYDPHLCKYYTQTDAQPQKGQELIKGDILQKYFQGSFDAYKEFNGGDMPDHIFIYRDGVGDAMRDQVLDKELTQLKKIVADNYPQGKLPQITLVFVNKRVRQRFFLLNGDEIRNPPQGTYVDQGFVEQQGHEAEGIFDFFVVPHNVTQGAAKPTHFYVAENTAMLSKQTILDFTNALCYNYPNWNDSIKVPAPCMLADRIAIYRTEVGSIPNSIDLLKLPFFL